MWDYRAALVRVVDGDTLVALIDQGFSGRQEEHLRLLDVSAPEIGQPGGLEAREWLAGWLAGAALSGGRWPLIVRTEPNTNPEPTERRSLTRYLAHVYHHDWPGPGARHLNAELREWLLTHPEWGSGR